MSIGGSSRANVRLLAYVATLAVGAAAVGLAGWDRAAPLHDSDAWPAVLAFAALLVAAEYLFVRFRFAGETNALNVMEAVLAPLLVAFPPTVAAATVAASQVVAAIVRRNAPVKAAFNVAQWTLAAGCGAAVVAVVEPARSDVRLVAAVLASLTCVGAVNQAAFTMVLAIAGGRRIGDVIQSLQPVMLPGWGAGWLLNSTIGLLFVFAYHREPFAVLLFPVPLVVLHLAYRGYAETRTDRIRLTGVHRAVGRLAEPLDPYEAVPGFLHEVAAAFDARAAALALVSEDAVEVHEVDRASGVQHLERVDRDASTLAVAAIALDGVTRVTQAGPPRLRTLLDATGARDALLVPLVDDGEPVGALIILDQGGLDGFEAGELAVLDALARETTGIFAKGRLLGRVLEERRRTAEIVDSTSDGILTLDRDGVIRSWNRALEHITGFPAAQTINRPVDLVLRPTNPAGEPVRLEHWAAGADLVSQLDVVGADGSRRRLSCSYGNTSDDRLGRLVVIARDLTPSERFEELRLELGRLAKAEAAQREVVAALQAALLPAPPETESSEFAVSHVPSDEHAPTGGDLYDWQLLPDGTVHVAVTDVLGHGVTATKHALAVISTLRLLALQNCPLADMVARADALLGDQDPDLVATVVVARYDPTNGDVAVAGGGHPPALLLSPTHGTSQLSAPGSPIGWPNAGSETVVHARLDPGDALVLYTDGLVEARRNILDGLDSLVAHATEVTRRPARELVEELVSRALAGAERRDDSLALAIRRLPVGARAATRRWSLPSTTAAGRQARTLVRTFLLETRIERDVVDDLVTVASELVTNAVQGGATEVSLSASCDGERVVIDVADDGHGDPELAARGWALPGDDRVNGRGLFIVRALTHDLSILSTAEGTAIRATRLLPVVSPADGV